MRQFICLAALLVYMACSSSVSQESVRTEKKDICNDSLNRTGEEDNSINDTIPAGAYALIKAYPSLIRSYKNNKIIFTDGTEMQYDDGREKTYLERLDDSDIEDMFFYPYKLPTNRPGYLEDAGRSRCDRLFKKIYGASAVQVQAKLVRVNWFGQTVRFTSVNGADKQLEKVAVEISKHPELLKYMKCSGTFYWRNVRGAKRMSAHSYGIAIDIAVSYSDYWLWKNPRAKETDTLAYANRIPRKIVEIFQCYGFIWGGAWYHYDTMHFEYRPELLIYAG